MPQPTLVIIAGVNGAGKSSFTASRPGFLVNFPLLDPDAVAKVINPADFEGSVLAAGREVLETAQRYLAAKESFVVETTFSGHSYLRIAREAKALGYNVAMVYVGLASVELSIERVRRRVRLGGHNVPEEDIRRRYERSLRNLKIAVETFDFVGIFDNSTDAQGGRYDILAIAERGKVTWLAPIPAWAAHLAATC